MRIIDRNIATQERGIYRISSSSKKGVIPSLSRNLDAEMQANQWQSIDPAKQSQQKLTDQQILELSELIIEIENHYGFPCDIEWAFHGGQFYIVQSRPITTLQTESQEIENKSKAKRFHKEDYFLSFWVQGVSVFVTDIHVEAYKALETLFVIDQGMFKQYFTKAAYEKALDEGLAFYSDKHKFDSYRKELLLHCDRFKEFFDSKIKNKQKLSRSEVLKFFEYTKKLCGDYAQMNFERTDKAFLQQETNPIIKKNLVGVAEFKDQVRAIMNTVLFEESGYLTKFFTIIGRQLQVTPSILENLTQQEILDLFAGKRVNESVVAKRQETFVTGYGVDGFLEGESARDIVREFSEEVQQLDFFKGVTASKGKIVGRVKIIPVDYSDLTRVNGEMEKMQQGDILIAETTAPELIVACKKAGAIVTDMGGLMSHAAIVSREFGIPCVIGTKNASKILHDGDLVEVDADHGVVRILERVSD